MKTTDELMQRCFDNDLSDEELRTLFGTLARSGPMRKEFTSLMELRSQLAVLPTVTAPASLDARIARTAAIPGHASSPASLRLILSRTLKLPAVAAAVAAVVMLIGGFLAGRGMTERNVVKEYYYFSELPAYVVQSSLTDIRNN